MEAIGITALILVAGIVYCKVVEANARKRPLLPKSRPGERPPGCR